MKKNGVIIASILIVTLMLTFQNCSQNGFSTESVTEESSVVFTPTKGKSLTGNSSAAEQAAANTSSNTTNNSTANNTTTATINAINKVECAAAAFEWQVGTQRCSASRPKMDSSNPEVVLFDNQSPVTGKVTVTCNASGVLSIKSSDAKTCTAEPVIAPAPTRQVRALQSVYSVHDTYPIVATSVKVSEVIFACIQSRDDGSYPCINGDISKRYFEVARPSNPISPDQELLWSYKSFYAIPGIDFTDYEVMFMRKNASGQLTDVIGSAIVAFRLPNDILASTSSGKFTSSAGPTVFEYVCYESYMEASAPAGYKTYNYFSSKACYYKISS